MNCSGYFLLLLLLFQRTWEFPDHVKITMEDKNEKQILLIHTTSAPNKENGNILFDNNYSHEKAGLAVKWKDKNDEEIDFLKKTKYFKENDELYKNLWYPSESNYLLRRSFRGKGIMEGMLKHRVRRQVKAATVVEAKKATGVTAVQHAPRAGPSAVQPAVVGAVVKPAIPAVVGAATVKPAIPAVVGAAKPAVPGAVIAKPAAPSALPVKPAVPGAVTAKPAVPGALNVKPGAPAVPGSVTVKPAAPAVAGPVPGKPANLPPKPGLPIASVTAAKPGVVPMGGAKPGFPVVTAKPAGNLVMPGKPGIGMMPVTNKPLGLPPVGPNRLPGAVPNFAPPKMGVPPGLPPFGAPGGGAGWAPQFNNRPAIAATTAKPAAATIAATVAVIQTIAPVLSYTDKEDSMFDLENLIKEAAAETSSNSTAPPKDPFNLDSLVGGFLGGLANGPGPSTPSDGALE